MFSLYRLVLKTNLKSPVILFPFIFPVIMILMYSVNVSSQADTNAIVVTVLTISIMQAGLMGFGFNFMNLKKSVMLRRIGATKMTKLEVLVAIMLYGLTTWAMSIVWIFGLAEIFSVAGLFKDSKGITYQIAWNSYNWKYMFLAVIVGLFLSFSMGIFISSVSKNINQFQGITMMYFFAAMLLGGLAFSPSSLTPWMEYIGYIIPHAYFSQLMVWSSQFNMVDNLLVDPPLWKIILDYLVPIIIGILSLIGAVKFLKFD